MVHDLLEEIAPGIWVEHIYDDHPKWIIVVAVTFEGTPRTLHLVRDAVRQYGEDGLLPKIVSELGLIPECSG